MDTNLKEERNDLQWVGTNKLTLDFILDLQMEALWINTTKSLFSSNLTKEVEIEDPNGQEDSDLDQDPEEDTRIIM
jgi:hypothetical protein